MGIRFGKRIKLGKHFRVNLSTRGVGYSTGFKGFTVGTGPRGSRYTASLPGTGLSYSQRIRGGQKKSSTPPRAAKVHPVPPQRTVEVPKPPSPGLLAPSHEKEFYKALMDYQAGKHDEALKHFLAAAKKEPAAAILASTRLASSNDKIDEAITLLESVVTSDAEFPTPLMQKYIAQATIKIDVTQEIQATVPLGDLGAALLLAELYQRQGRLQEAIGMLEELDELVDQPILTLSLCDLYAAAGIWDGIIACAEKITVSDDITLETAVLRGRALQEKGLHDAAITAFTNAIKQKKGRDPDLINEALYWRAISYEAAGKKSQANKEFQKIYAENAHFRDVSDRINS